MTKVGIRRAGSIVTRAGEEPVWSVEWHLDRISPIIRTAQSPLLTRDELLDLHRAIDALLIVKGLPKSDD